MRPITVRPVGTRFVIQVGGFGVAVLTLAELEQLHQNAGFALANAPTAEVAA